MPVTHYVYPRFDRQNHHFYPALWVPYHSLNFSQHNLYPHLNTIYFPNVVSGFETWLQNGTMLSLKGTYDDLAISDKIVLTVPNEVLIVVDIYEDQWGSQRLFMRLSDMKIR